MEEEGVFVVVHLVILRNSPQFFVVSLCFSAELLKKWKLYKGFNLYKELSVKIFMMQLYKKYDNTTNNGKLFALV